MRKWWALYIVIILIVFLGWRVRENFIENHLTYRILNVYFTPGWECGRIGRINLAKFTKIKENRNIWTIKSNDKVFDIDINKSDLIFDKNDMCVNHTMTKE